MACEDCARQVHVRRIVTHPFALTSHRFPLPWALCGVEAERDLDASPMPGACARCLAVRAKVPR